MEFIPKWIAWEITRRCNFGCVHCRSSSEMEVQGHPDFSFDEAKRILADIHSYANPVVVLSGGEPSCGRMFFTLLPMAQNWVCACAWPPMVLW